MDTRLEIAGTRIEISADDPGLIATFVAVFSEFVLPPGAPPREAGRPPVQVRVDGRGGEYSDGRRVVPLAGAEWRSVQVYNLLYTTMARSLEEVFLLHAAAVEREGRCYLISAPSGSGKTSLARGLVRRGFGFMSDDLAPLSASDGRVHPFPRRVGLDPAGDATTSEDLAQGIAVGDKCFVPPSALGGRLVTEPLPLGGVVIMNPYRDGAEPGLVRMQIGALGDGVELRRRLAEIPGVRVEASPMPRPGALLLRLDISGGKAIAAVMEALAGADRDILFHSRQYSDHKAYARSPAIAPLPVREAAIALLREMLNREPDSALMRAHGGSAAALLFALLGLLGEVPCWRLVPGSKDDTADLLAERLGSGLGPRA